MSSTDFADVKEHPVGIGSIPLANGSSPNDKAPSTTSEEAGSIARADLAVVDKSAERSLKLKLDLRYESHFR